MGNKSKASVLREYHKPPLFEEVADPTINDGDVLVRIKACGICATDVKIVENKGPQSKLPLILGHEPAGIIENITSESALKVGDGVVVHPHIYCGNCLNCISGNENICLNVKGSMGITINGGLAEYLVSPARNLVPFPKSVPVESAALAGGTVAVPLAAIKRAGNLVGKSALILGTGGLGLSAVQILRNSGVELTVLGRREENLRLAEKLGADHVINITAGDYVNTTREIAGGQGVDIAFDIAGASTEVPRLLKTLKRGGQLVIIGYSPENIDLPYQKLALDALHVVGSRTYTRQDLRDAVQLIAGGRVKPIISATLPLAETAKALDMVRTGSLAGRVIITP